MRKETYDRATGTLIVRDSTYPAEVDLVYSPDWEGARVAFQVGEEAEPQEEFTYVNMTLAFAFV